ncbi:MAG: hypothetical protein CW338_05030 [Clostridiales bacterium]|nr:hypothetical protein [Clostridiales bacterium]
MEVISRASKKIMDLWSPGKPKETVYRLFSYVLKMECEDGVLLENAVTGELLLLNPQEAEQLNGLPCAYDAWMDRLIEKRFIIEESLKDASIVDGLRRACRLTENSRNITGYTILPTSACNARCFYCYECDYPHIAMSKETADKAVEFIAAHCGEKKKISIGWFGGEPLLGIERMNQIVDGLTERGIAYASSIISNGYYFTEDTVKIAKEKWNLTNAQITLDGREEIYNQTKAYVNPEENPYKRVISNIGHLAAAGIRVSIRLNLGLHNYDELALLLKELAQTFPDKKLIRPYVAVLFEDMGFVPFHAEGGQLEQLYIRRAELKNLIGELGFGGHGVSGRMGKDGLPSLRPVHCMADNDRSLVINPQGRFAKCEHYTFEMMVGDLDNGITDPAMQKEWKTTRYFEQCRECVFYPICVKLKNCAPERNCTKYDVDDKTGEARAAMRNAYSAWQKRKAEAEQKKADEMNAAAEAAEQEDEEDEVPVSDENC